MTGVSISTAPWDWKTRRMMLNAFWRTVI